MPVMVSAHNPLRGIPLLKNNNNPKQALLLLLAREDPTTYIPVIRCKAVLLNLKSLKVVMNNQFLTYELCLPPAQQNNHPEFLSAFLLFLVQQTQRRILKKPHSLKKTVKKSYNQRELMKPITRKKMHKLSPKTIKA
jgi:hypothetical protein